MKPLPYPMLTRSRASSTRRRASQAAGVVPLRAFVAQRTRESGIRLALGARPKTVQISDESA